MPAPWRILLVDDNRSLLEALGDILEAQGCCVDLAYDGIQAIDRARAVDYDCIFMDIRMPKMSGFEALKQLKELSPATPVILMTAYSVQGLLDEALAEGVVTVLSKPLAMERLLRVLENLKGKGSVLLLDVTVDDALECVFRTHGYTFTSARTVGEALSLMARRSHDIVSLDAEIPGLESGDSILVIRDWDPKCLALLMTATSEISSNPFVYASLQKPFKMQEVIALLDRILAQRHIGN